jgi:hypothetical protein
MRSWRAMHNLLAVSANTQETAINTEQDEDTSMLVSMTDVIQLEPNRETNENELIGQEEPDTIYDLGALAALTMNFEKAQPQHFAFGLAYALGSISTAAAGALGYEHTITPIANDVDASRSNPSFTAMMRYGSTVLKRRFASMFIDTLAATFARDQWAKLVLGCKGTGKVSDNITEESITVTPGADPFPLSTTLTLAANAVEGDSAAERLQNVHRIRVELASGEWTDVEFTAVSDDDPAEITIEAMNANDADDVTYKVLYIPDEPAWCTFPARITETPLRVTDLSVSLGGVVSSGAYSVGRAFACEIESIEYNLANNLQLEMCLGGSGAYADRAFRDGRVQTLKFNREFRDYILQQHIDDNDTFAVQIKAEGAEYEAGHNYTVELLFPKVGILSAPISVNGKRLAEAGDFRVLEDATEGSVIATVKNLVDTYAA